MSSKTAGTHLKSKTKEKHEGNKGRSALIAVILVVLILLAAFAAFGIVIGKSDKIHPNISIFGTDVGGLTVAEATKLFENSGALDAGETLAVSVTGGYSFDLNQKDADMLLTPGQAAELAYGFGHSGNPFADAFTYIRCLLGSFDGKVALKDASTKALEKLVTDSLTELSGILEEGYLVDLNAGTLKLIKGASGKLDTAGLCAEIASAFSQGKNSLDYSVKLSENAAAPDFDAIHDSIFAECVPAEYDSEKDEITQHSVGVDFDTEKARELWDKAKTGALVEIKLDITEPEHTKEALEKLLFADVLGTYTTDYSTSDANRANNVELAASKINGVILMPGEEFSYNDVVQKRTEEAGFKPAAAYAGGTVVSEVGGGICQVSTTLYCAALYANLKITARDCHHFLVGYVPTGLDATVSWGGPEFKFVNDREYPIKINASFTSARKLTVEILGTDVDGSYVEMISQAYGCYDATYPDVLIGYAANSYRYVYDRDGNLISNAKEAYSYYCLHDEDIAWPEEGAEEPIEEAPIDEPPIEEPTETEGESA